MTDYSQMSDEDLLKLVQPQQSIDYSQMSDEDLLKLVAPQPVKPAEQGYFSRVGSNIMSNLNAGADLISHAEDNPLINAIQVGSKAANAVSAPVAEAGVSAFRALPQSWQDKAASMAQSVGSVAKNAGEAIGDYGMNNPTLKAASDYIDTSPNLNSALEQSARGLGGAANIAMTVGGGKVAQPTIASAAEQIAENPAGKFKELIKDGAKQNIPKVEPATPEDLFRGISNKYDEVKAVSNNNFKTLEKLGEGQLTDASGLKSHLQDIISDVEKEPFAQERKALPTLKRVRDMLADSDYLPLNDAVQLKRDFNQYFDVKSLTQDSGSTYGKAAKTLDNMLERAGERNPEFAAVNQAANQDWLNNVHNAFQKNSVLNKFWKPQDHYNIKSFDADGNEIGNVKLDYIPDETQQRMDNLFSNISQRTDLNALTRAMPEEQAVNFLKDYAEQLKSQTRKGELIALGRNLQNLTSYVTPRGWTRTVRGVVNVVSPETNPNIRTLLARTKQAPSRLSNAHSSRIEDILNSIKQEQGLADEMMPFGSSSMPKPESVNMADFVAARNKAYGLDPNQSVTDDVVNLYERAKQREAARPMRESAANTASDWETSQMGVKNVETNSAKAARNTASDFANKFNAKQSASGQGAKYNEAFDELERQSTAQKAADMAKSAPRTPRRAKSDDLANQILADKKGVGYDARTGTFYDLDTNATITDISKYRRGGLVRRKA